MDTEIPTVTHLPEALKATALHHWARFEEACERACVVCPADSAERDAIMRLFAFSDYAAFHAHTHPDWMVALLEGGIEEPRKAKIYDKLLQAQIKADTTEAALMSHLRQFRHKEMIRILWRFLLEKTDLNTHLKELSSLADVLIKKTYRLAYEQLETFYGTPMAYGKKQHLVVVALGKLGAEELNFSSDVDLMLCFAQHGQTEQGEKSLENERFFTLVAQKVIKWLSDITEDGFVYRVDLRLRPHGRSGPLVLSYNALETYYQIHGRDWERYALVKSRILTGTRSDKKSLSDSLSRFIYRRYLDFSVFHSLKDMKAKVHYEVKKRKLQNHLKLGPGGIRQIEFIAQMFQLIRGGKEWQFQERRLLVVLERLEAAHIISTKVASKLSKAYAFLRRSEHFLQMINDEQTHSLPEDTLSQARLCWAMGYENYRAYIKACHKHTHYVSKQFDKISTPLAEKKEKSSQEESFALQVWVQPEEVEIPTSLKKLGLTSAFFERISHFKKTTVVKSLRPHGRERLDKLMPRLIHIIFAYSDKEALLNNVLAILSKVARRSSYLLLLNENPKALERLILLCSQSAWVAKQMALFPILLDELLSPLETTTPVEKAELQVALDQAMRWYEDDLDAQMERLRQFKLAYTLKLVVSDLLSNAPLDVGLHLTHLAEVIIEKIYHLAFLHVYKKYYEGADPPSHMPVLGIIAYGNLGSMDMHYQSDLDLVFVYEDLDTSSELNSSAAYTHEFYVRLAQRMIHMLSTQTLTGNLYDVDVRLRPGGGAGLLVTNLSAYEKYLERDAWTWEHQALVRARLLMGTASLQSAFKSLRTKVLCGAGDDLSLKSKIQGMREKIKHHTKQNLESIDIKNRAGGLIDIEFLVQYFVLRHSKTHKNLLEDTKTHVLIETLHEVGVLTGPQAHDLTNALHFYQKKLRMQILQPLSAEDRESFESWCEQMEQLWQHFFEDA